jgi:hypothetical protein
VIFLSVESATYYDVEGKQISTDADNLYSNLDQQFAKHETEVI